MNEVFKVDSEQSNNFIYNMNNKKLPELFIQKNRSYELDIISVNESDCVKDSA